MRLILREKVAHLGQAGDLVTVKPGYARNFLIPKGLAYRATEANVRRIEEERRIGEERARRAYLEANRRASRLEGVTLTFTARASPEGTLFGSVGMKDIFDRLQESEIGFELDKRSVLLDEPIKSIGEHIVPLRLHAGVETEVQVIVEAEED
ncbi:MAG: 50S ribosomal protein L9 [Gemmatimonadetes bacterium]|nr:50S ribosomal protein L9 [Gemmatimonadota bacterium]MYE15653.1 50S ribosomal protein L9 [Gemmatimonadota bacterium]